MGCKNLTLDVQYYCILSCSLLSVFGSLLIIFPYIFFPKIRNFSFKIIFFIAISDFVRSLNFTIPSYAINNQISCKLSAYILQCTIIFTIGWTTAISTTLYKIVLKSQQEFGKDTLFWSILCVITCLISLVPMINNNSGLYGTMCSYKKDTDGDLFRLALTYIPAWLGISISLYCYIKIYTHISEINLDDCRKLILQKFVMYPFSLIAVYLPLSMARLLEYFIDGCWFRTFEFFAILVLCLHGLMNSLIYIWTLNIKELIKQCRTNPRSTDFFGSINVTGSNTTNLLFSSFVD